MSTPLALYRQFLRLGSQAVQFKQPQTKIIKAVIRQRFAEGPAPDALAIQNTLQFFRAAAYTNGLERRCVATMVHYCASRHRRAEFYARSPSMKLREEPLVETNERFYSEVVQGLNTTMQLCL